MSLLKIYLLLTYQVLVSIVFYTHQISHIRSTRLHSRTLKALKISKILRLKIDTSTAAILLFPRERNLLVTLSLCNRVHRKRIRKQWEHCENTIFCRGVLFATIIRREIFYRTVCSLFFFLLSMSIFSRKKRRISRGKTTID